MSDDKNAPYDGLSPETILDAVEAAGFEPSGALTGLNSYENRVYQVQLSDDSFVVTKFYRPGRWSEAQIAEEHQFSQELIENELPIVVPIEKDGTSLFVHNDFQFAVFLRQGGHPPNIEIEENLEVLARTIGRIHAQGRVNPFQHRPELSVDRLGHDSRKFLLETNWIPPDLLPAYETTTEHLLERCDEAFASKGEVYRIHGDLHLGNLLWRDDTPHFVDFDDTVTGPPIQDLWMLLSGEHLDRQHQLGTILDAYFQFNEFDLSSLHLIEPLRTLRIMHHAAWIARRWHDPAFPVAFPYFDSAKYWSEHILDLREQQSAMDEPVLRY